MLVRYRVALHGFSQFERDSLGFCFKHANSRERRYDPVYALAESDFIVADADRELLEGKVAHAGRMSDTLFVGNKVPPGAIAHVKRPIDPQRILRALDDMVLQLNTARAVATRDSQPNDVLPIKADNTLRSQHENTSVHAGAPALTFRSDFSAASEPAISNSGKASMPPPPTVDLALPEGRVTVTAADGPQSGRAAAKAAAQTASRRARLAHAAPADGAPTKVVDVLVLDSDPTPNNLCMLLAAFGFRVHRVDTSEQAIALLREKPLAVTFFDFALSESDDTDGLDLCRRIKQGRLTLAGAAPAVMMVCSHVTGTIRVQAKLAGCDAILRRPAARGDVARALEARGIALPTDPRRR